MRAPTLLLLLSAAGVSACVATPEQAAPTPPPLVKTVTLGGSPGMTLGLSGTVRARVESPLGFQVPGRIARRAVDAGQTVTAGQVLFELDQRDLQQMVRAAEADLAAAESALANANAELARQRKLLEQQFTSAQALEQVQLLQRQMQSQHAAASARLAQARNGLGYARLQAPAGGVLTEVSGEAGQVVGAGQPVAMLAQAGEREVEVYFPENQTPPASGSAVLADGSTLALKLRETAGAVDPYSRTRRARYTVQQPAGSLLLGAVLRTRFSRPQAAAEGDFSVPLAAIDERGTGPRVWQIKQGRVQPVPISLLALDQHSARIRAPLSASDKVVALGTHLLIDNMAVRELGQ